MSDAKIAKKVLGEFADDLDRLTDIECLQFVKEKDLDAAQCKALQGALGSGTDAFVTVDEYERLEKKFDLSRGFLDELVGKDGGRPLHFRAKWLSDFYVIQLKADKNQRRAVRDELLNMGSAAVEAVPAFSLMVSKGQPETAARAAAVLGGMGAKAKDAVPALIECLMRAAKSGGDDELVHQARIEAAKALGMIGRKEKAAIALISVLNDEQESLRPYAAEALGRMGAKEAVYDLVLAAHSQDPVLWKALKNAFAMLNVDSKMIVLTLIQILNGENGEDATKRAYAAGALGRMGKEAHAAIPDLIKAMKHEDLSVREEAAYALAQIGTKESLVELSRQNTDEAVAAFLSLLESETPGVRRAAALLLGNMGAIEAIEPLREIVKNKDENVDLRKISIEALGKLGDRKSLPAFRSLLSEKDFAVSAAKALGSLGANAKRAVPDLIQALKGDDLELKIVATWALGRIGVKAKAAFAAVEEGLYSGDTKLIEASTLALLMIDPDKAYDSFKEIGEQATYMVPILEGCMKEKDKAIAKSCVRSLALFGPAAKTAVPALMEALNSKDAGLRLAAAHALGMVGPEALEAGSLLFGLITSDPDKTVRASAVWAISKIGMTYAKCVPALLTALSDQSNSIRADAEQALGQIDKAMLIPALLLAMTDKDAELARAAAKLLAEMGGGAESALPTLCTIVSVGETDRRIMAADVLGEMGGAAKDAIPDLQQAAKAGDAKLKKVALAALEKIGAPAEAPAVEEPAVEKPTAKEPTVEMPAVEEPAAEEPKPEVDDKIRSLIERAVGGDAKEKSAAVGTLIKMGKKAKKALVNAMGDADPDFAAKAATALAAVSSSEDAVIALAVALTSGKEPLCKAALLALTGLGKKVGAAAGMLGMLLSHKDQRIRRAAAFLLGRAGDAAAAVLPQLLAARTDSDETLKKYADQCIRGISRKKLVKGLIKSISNEDPKIRLAAAIYMWDIGEEAGAAIPSLLAARQDKDEKVRKAVDLAIKRIGADRLIPELKKALRHKDAAIRMAAAIYLWDIGPEAKSAIADLKRASKDKDEKVRKAALLALKRISGS
ncbi:MAG: HEAT repeat domain-containing protein [bacterium]